MKQKLEIPFGDFVSSGSTLDLLDLVILAALFNGKPTEHSCVQINKRSAERILSPYSIGWSKLKTRLDVLHKLGYIIIQQSRQDTNVIVMKNAELLFNGRKVKELTIPANQVPLIEETEEEKMYLNWLVNTGMTHSTYVTKAKTDQETRQKLLRSYRMIRKVYAKEDVFHAIRFATTDEFWRKNFLSPLKLEQVQKSSGMKYIDFFLSLKNSAKSTATAPAQKIVSSSRSLD